MRVCTVDFTISTPNCTAASGTVLVNFTTQQFIVTVIVTDELTR